LHGSSFLIFSLEKKDKWCKKFKEEQVLSICSIFTDPLLQIKVKDNFRNGCTAEL